jgi:hypothetical protein
MKNKVYTYGAPFFSPDYSVNDLAAQMSTNSNEQSIYIRFVCSILINHTSADKMSADKITHCP